MTQTRIAGYRCLRCGHEWKPRKPTRPVVCANRKCQSPYWDRPRQQPKEATT